MDIICCLMTRAFGPLAVVMDGASRGVLARALTIRMHSDLGVRAMETAIRLSAGPENVNTAQVWRLKSGALGRLLLGAGSRISLDCRGARMRGVFVDRLQPSVQCCPGFAAYLRRGRRDPAIDSGRQRAAARLAPG